MPKPRKQYPTYPLYISDLVQEGIWAEFKRMAEKDDRTIGNVLKRLVREYVASHTTKEPV